jgi:hypothetical protein
LGNAPLNSRLGIVVGRDGAVISAQVSEGSSFGVGRLWAARLSQGTELELGHGGFRQVRLAPVELP